VPKILFGFSPIGLGHATRAVVLSDQLRRGGADVRLFSGGKAAEFVRSLGYEVDDIVDDPVPSVAKLAMRRVALWYIRSWFAYRRTLSRTLKLYANYLPDLVIGDEEFTGMEAARRGGKKRVFITDELELGFGRSWLSKKIEGRIERWYRRLQNSVDLLIIPNFGPNEGNRKFVGPIVRPIVAPCADVRMKHGLPEGAMILVSLSGSGIGKELIAKSIDYLKVNSKGRFLVVTGNRGKKVGGEGIHDLGLVSDNQDLVACADVVISTAGKSTIDEAAVAGTPIVVIPIANHAEQVRNASELGYNPADIDKLPALIEEKIGRREEPKRFSGEIEASRLILSL
jgi:UDP-N-acetylglucosamine--N-acetylmuramyl-(pentapeptide) pyrophosphoryl-undecaprenol N-acetylglucosamine transferase